MRYCLLGMRPDILFSFYFPQDLRQWLNERKEEGYSIVGVEQTSSSVSLSSYRFPQKCVSALFAGITLICCDKGIPNVFLHSISNCRCCFSVEKKRVSQWNCYN